MHKWKRTEDKPDWYNLPIRHFIRAEGFKEHSGVLWNRVWFDVAYIAKDGPLGYRGEDIERCRKDGDMDLVEKVTHWKPALFEFKPENIDE